MLSPSSCANAISVVVDETINSWPLTSFPFDFAQAYTGYAQAGVLSSGGGVAGNEDSSIISNYLNSFPSETDESDFAQMLADFWSTCLIVPAGDTISISNNAPTKVGAFREAILASITASESIPYYLNFITNIEAVVKTIQWVAIKPNPLPPTLETIS